MSAPMAKWIWRCPPEAEIRGSSPLGGIFLWPEVNDDEIIESSTEQIVLTKIDYDGS